jgi:hypothetical protein
MKIRLMGTPADIAQAVTILAQVPALGITEISSSYPNRVRVPRSELCPVCGVQPGTLHTPKCFEYDRGREIWPGFIHSGDTCPDCRARPGQAHTPKCGARDSGEEIWPSFPFATRLVRVYIEAQLRPGHGSVP